MDGKNTFKVTNMAHNKLSNCFSTVFNFCTVVFMEQIICCWSFFIPFEFPMLLSKVCLFYSCLITLSHTAKGRWCYFARLLIICTTPKRLPSMPLTEVWWHKNCCQHRDRTNNLTTRIFRSRQLHHHPVIFRPSINKTGLPGGLGAAASNRLWLESPWAQSF